MSSNTVQATDEHSEESKALAEAIEQEKMHGWDFAFSLVVMVFSVGVVATALTMPFSGTVGGITTEWYESPGLLPLFIGVALFAAGLSVFVQSKNAQGREKFFKYFKEINPKSFLISAGGIISYIYVLITWYDFFLASTAFLLLYIGLYYLDNEVISRKLLKIYYGAIALSIALFLTGIDDVVNSGYAFTTDIILLVTIVALFLTMYGNAKKISPELVKKVKKMTLIAIIFPAALCPIFRYFLLVPLPKEGIVVEQVFNYTYYNYINTGTETEAMDLSDEQLSELEDAF
ncbi:tripartite tricarboxylate transporter TctB family protein [Vibrio sp. HN007]|uniref:tripartite tricarboxylate transporter TctB family protein n=1 Tax=Vibrio iocasae TaxID=3098914 RepID=UPI0035D3DEF8